MHLARALFRCSEWLNSVSEFMHLASDEQLKTKKLIIYQHQVMVRFLARLQIKLNRSSLWP